MKRQVPKDHEYDETGQCKWCEHEDSSKAVHSFTYPHLTAMSTNDLATMLRCVSEYPENADFAKAIVEEIKYRKPTA